MFFERTFQRGPCISLTLSSSLLWATVVVVLDCTSRDALLVPELSYRYFLGGVTVMKAE